MTKIDESRNGSLQILFRKMEAKKGEITQRVEKD